MPKPEEKSSENGRIFFYHKNSNCLIFLTIFCLFLSNTYATVSWTGLGGDNYWSTSHNWLDDIMPDPFAGTDSVLFSIDSESIDVVDSDWSIAHLQYTGTGSHITGLNAGSTLEVLGTVYTGNNNSNLSITWANGGQINIGNFEKQGSLNIGLNSSSSGVNNSSLRLDDISVNLNGELNIGRKSSDSGAGKAIGNLILGSNSKLYAGTKENPNAIINIGMNQSYSNPLSGGAGNSTGVLDALESEAVVGLYLNELNIGRHTLDGGSATGTLKWNQEESIYAKNVYFGRGQSTGVLEVPEGGTIKFGYFNAPVNSFNISYHDTDGRGDSNANLDFAETNPYFEAYIDGELNIGRKSSESGVGTANGNLMLGSNSILYVGTKIKPDAIVNIGMNQSNSHPFIGGESDGTGVLDARYGKMEMHLSELNVGRHTNNGGTATGTLTTGYSSVITADTVQIGTGHEATGTVNLQGGYLAGMNITVGTGGLFNFMEGRLAVDNFYGTSSASGALNQNGGTLAPGFSHSVIYEVGLTTIYGDYNISSLGNLEMQLFGTKAGLAYDQLRVNGNVNLNSDNGQGAILDIILGYTPKVGDEYILIDNDDSITMDPIIGSFAWLPEGHVFTKTYLGESYYFQISYTGGTGNDVVLNSVVPEPATILLLGLGNLLLLRIRKKIAT